MAKNVPRKKRTQHKNQPYRAGYHLRFIFPDPATSGISSEYLTEFTGKIKPGLHSRCSVSYLTGSKEPSLPVEGVTPLRVEAGKPPGEEGFDTSGYAVILDDGPFERLFNPNEFLQLSLPDKPEERTYYHVTFQGKSTSGQAGLIVPAGVVFHLLAVAHPGKPLERGTAEFFLEKLGFGKNELVIHQDPPVGERRQKGPALWNRLGLNLTYFTAMPLRESRLPASRRFTFAGEHPLFRLAFFGTAIAVFILLPILSQDAGLSGDDEKHYRHAAKVHRYFTEDDPAALDDPRHKLNFYGQSFDYFTYLLIRLFGLEEDPYAARHAMVAVTGAAAILVVGLVVTLFAGYAGGLLALLLMFLSPRFLGHSFNNPMDVPFALGYIFTIYHLILFLRKLPRISTRSAIWMAVGIGWTNGIRIGGLILIPYLFMFSGLYLLLSRWPWKFFSAGWWRFALRGLVTLVLVSAAGYLISLLTWPYALQDIINHPIQAFKVMSNIQVSIRVLYDGIVQWSDRLPWHYIPKNVWLTVPVIILLGWLASSLTWRLKGQRKYAYWYFLLWFTAVFPVIFIIIRESNVYGGWRHMMFIYPPMLALAAMALTSLIRHSPGKWVRFGLLALVLAGLVHPARHIIANHPHTYIYFNEWSGGINRTYGKYETDYYTNSLGPASEYFIREFLPAAAGDTTDPIRVVSNADIAYYFRNHRDRAVPFYSRYYDRGKYDWDYAILYCNYIHPYQLNHDLWPPARTVHELKVDDVTVAAIVERKNRDDFRGSTLLAEAVRESNEEKLQQAISYLNSAIEFDPHNEAAHLELGSAYTAYLRFDEARRVLDNLLEIYPDYDKALNLKGYSYLVQADVNQQYELVDEAIRFIGMAVDNNYKFYSGYYNLGLCYAMKNDKQNAIYYFREAIRYNGKFAAAYQKLAEVHEYYGEHEMAEAVRAQLRRLQ